MKKCPVCNYKTISYKWNIFGKSKNKNGNCIKCSNCGKNIRKKRLLILEFALFNNEIFYIILLLLILNLMHKLFNYYYFVIPATIIFIIGLSIIVDYLWPLSEADESYCRDNTTKIIAVFAFIAIVSIIIFIIYELFIK